MSKVDEYRGFAATALDMAEKATDPCGKTRLLDMAEAWLSLGERTSHPPKQSGRALREHPLIAATRSDAIRQSWNRAPYRWMAALPTAEQKPRRHARGYGRKRRGWRLSGGGRHPSTTNSPR